MDLRSPSASHSAHRHSVDTWLLCRVFNSELTSIAHVARYCSTQSLSALTSVLDAWTWRQEAHDSRASERGAVPVRYTMDSRRYV